MCVNNCIYMNDIGIYYLITTCFVLFLRNISALYLLCTHMHMHICRHCALPHSRFSACHLHTSFLAHHKITTIQCHHDFIVILERLIVVTLLRDHVEAQRCEDSPARQPRELAQHSANIAKRQSAVRINVSSTLIANRPQ